MDRLSISAVTAGVKADAIAKSPQRILLSWRNRRCVVYESIFSASGFAFQGKDLVDFIIVFIK